MNNHSHISLDTPTTLREILDILDESRAEFQRTPKGAPYYRTAREMAMGLRIAHAHLTSLTRQTNAQQLQLLSPLTK
jgi:hypothetical protein